MNTELKDESPTAVPKNTEKGSVIDTSKMSEGERNALELTEEARAESEYRSFAGDLFMGKFPIGRIHPFPEQPDEDVEAGRPFLTELEKILAGEVDPDLPYQ
jgi:hypothetical protein